MSPHASSDLPGNTRGPRVAARGLPVPLFGLAPGGVYLAVGVAVNAVRSYRTISPLPSVFRLSPQHGLAVYFLWHLPWARAPQALPGTLPYGARTFLPARKRAERLSGRLPMTSLPEFMISQERFAKAISESDAIKNSSSVGARLRTTRPAGSESLCPHPSPASGLLRVGSFAQIT